MMDFLKKGLGQYPLEPAHRHLVAAGASHAAGEVAAVPPYSERFVPPLYDIQSSSDSSFRMLELRGATSGCSWHFHPEHQIGYVIRGAGQRIVGDSVCPIRPGELILLGANLPHVWRYHADSDGNDSAHAFVIQFHNEWLGSEFFDRPEMHDIRLLLARASVGLQINGGTRKAAVAIIRQMVDQTGFSRVLSLLSLLHLLAQSRELKSLCSAGFHPVTANLEVERLRRVASFVQRNYANPELDRELVAKVAHLSPSAFSRFFKARTGKTFGEFVIEVRVGHACRMLIESELNITEIAFRCGFCDSSSFNHTFRKIKLMTPTAYRSHLSRILNPDRPG